MRRSTAETAVARGKAVTSSRTPRRFRRGKARRRRWITQRVSGFFFAEVASRRSQGASRPELRPTPYPCIVSPGEMDAPTFCRLRGQNIGEMRGGCGATMSPGDHTMLIAYGENAPGAWALVALNRRGAQTLVARFAYDRNGGCFGWRFGKIWILPFPWQAGFGSNRSDFFCEHDTMRPVSAFSPKSQPFCRGLVP